MLYIGDWDKPEIIEDYIATHDVNKALIIYSKNLEEHYDLSIPCETLELSDSVKYVNYYHFLEYVDKWTLIIIDNILRSQHRRALEHNCINVITNQSKHHLVFNYLPFLNDYEDFMTLMDFNDKNKYSVELFNTAFIRDNDVKIRPVTFDMDFVKVDVSEKDMERYEAKKNKLFDELGESDPNTIPANLELFAGDVKYKNIEDKDQTFIFRNQRVKSKNIRTFKDSESGLIIDFPIRRTDLIDLLVKTKTHTVSFAVSDMKVDTYYMNDYKAWKKKLDDFYDEADLS